MKGPWEAGATFAFDAFVVLQSTSEYFFFSLPLTFLRVDNGVEQGEEKVRREKNERVFSTL